MIWNILSLDVASDRGDHLAKNVEIRRMEIKWDELHEKTQEDRGRIKQPQEMALVSETEYEYGADVFMII